MDGFAGFLPEEHAVFVHKVLGVNVRQGVEAAGVPGVKKVGDGLKLGMRMFPRGPPVQFPEGGETARRALGLALAVNAKDIAGIVPEEIGRNIDGAGLSLREGWVAVQRTTVAPYPRTSSLSAMTQGAMSGVGSICASSSTMTLLAILCSLRQRAGERAKRDSKNCTAVVTTSGTSQFSAARRMSVTAAALSSSCSAAGRAAEASGSGSAAEEWCSRTAVAPRGPRARRNSAAFCSMMLGEGMT
jgi:hypothetical protein